MSHSSNLKKRKAPTRGVDTILTVRGKQLAPGESVRFRLIKGPSVSSSGDPVDSKAPLQYFPMMAKFGESVVRPDFGREPWQSGRLFQQEVPKPVDDSDEEGAGDDDAAPKKKRWRYGDGEAPRQWILQENVDFLQSMVDRKEQKTAASSSDDQKTLSSRYEGTAEHNPSQYGLIRLMPGEDPDASGQVTLQVCLLPSPQDTNTTINFAQPASRKTYSLTEAEHVISDQRMGFVKSLHHMQPSAANGKDGQNGDGDGKDGESGEAAPRNILALRQKAANSTKGRLLSKLQQKSKATADNDEEEGDDVMGDVAFRSRKGGGAARKELLKTVADSVMVSDDGVLGGGNDAVFGGRQRFAQFKDSSDTKKEDGEGGADNMDNEAGGASGAQNKERGGDGAAMEDDFYQRDVKAEYDELDYDANEQFDDDDVDLGEAEQIIDSSGFKDDDIDDEMDDSDEEDGDVQDGGAEGLASLAGFKALLAKARGETPPETEANPVQAKQAADQKRADNRKREKVDHMSKIIAADEKARLDAERKAAQQRGGVIPNPGQSADDAAMNTADAEMMDAAAAPQEQQPTAAAPKETPLVDANGFRIITLEAVRREIWLNHGSIPMKRLMKIFEVKKKSAQERQDKFREVVKELCTMKQDPVNGRMLVLKQHYSKG